MLFKNMLCCYSRLTNRFISQSAGKFESKVTESVDKSSSAASSTKSQTSHSVVGKYTLNFDDT